MNTHMKKLWGVEESLRLFLNRVVLLENKLGPVLFQLQPGWKCNYERFVRFLKLLPEHLQYAFEFRNQTWINDKILDSLSRHDAAFCIYELDGFQTEKIVTADFSYIRLHGPSKAYTGKYKNEDLSQWAEFIKKQVESGRDAYCYFDNDQCAFAAQNAAELKNKLSNFKGLKNNDQE